MTTSILTTFLIALMGATVTSKQTRFGWVCLMGATAIAAAFLCR